jgi:hypothetical protein
MAGPAPRTARATAVKAAAAATGALAAPTALRAAGHGRHFVLSLRVIGPVGAPGVA